MDLAKKSEIIAKKTREYYKLRQEIAKMVHTFLKDFLDSIYGEFEFDDCNDVPCVAYDGGNHPEYASNLCNCVSRMYLKDGELYFDLEDEHEYCWDRMFIEDLLCIFDSVTGYLTHKD